MYRLIVLGLAVALFVPVQSSFAQMDEQMKEHMKDHMGGQMMQDKGEMKEKSQTQDSASLTMEAQAAGVTAKATYKNPGAPAPVFDVVLDTHSVELDQYRFEDIVALRDQAGGEHDPELVSSKGSGHHREATVEFKGADLTGSDYVELVIKDVAGIPERVLRFDLKGGAEKSL